MKHATSDAFSRRQFLAASALALGATGCLGDHEPAAPRVNPPLTEKPNIIVFLPDSLRADRIGVHGFELPVSPALDEFAQQAYVFEQCHTQATWTKPSIASLFTGVPPWVHEAGLGIHGHYNHHKGEAQVLRDDFALLAEELELAGYATAWFLENGVIASESLGFRRGMNHFEHDAQFNMPAQMRAIIQWMHANQDRPFFVFVHFVDPHYPFTPADSTYETVHGTAPALALEGMNSEDRDFCTAYMENPARLRGDEGRVNLEGKSAAVMDHIQRLYAAEIRGIDHQFSRLTGFLERTGLLDKSVVAYISDHGEAFGEHGVYYHMQPPYVHQTHVPLIVRMPGQTLQQRVPETVALYDLYSTFLAFAGLTPADYVQAQPLFTPTGTLAVDKNRTVISVQDGLRPYPDKWVYGITEGEKKLIIDQHKNTLEAYNLRTDPMEKNNLVANGSLPPALDGLRTHFEHTYARGRKQAKRFGKPAWTTEEQDMREAMEALGYL